MGLRESWNDLGTGGKIAAGLAVGFGLLLVGIVMLVVLAAVISSFVLGMGSQTAAVPQASFGFEHDAQSMTTEIVHEGGDEIDADRLSVVVEGRRVAWTSSDGTVGVGDSHTVDVQAGDSVQVRYEGEDGIATLDLYEVPE